ncbi:hypothetical protein GN958_ATG11742 [Phytophthora infestans]|uniref:Uncharacterized protein n=1 Tax=Phytophthora infestans TaxID=4787 RepID=A0A8S9UEL0_PHYIN|nr:hypothetical protein GN958_ATG11742 [Phytophthora infestans]
MESSWIIPDGHEKVHYIEMSRFSCVCWIKSVGALQGDGGLIRNTSLTLKNTAGLYAKINYTEATGAVKAADKQLQKFLEFYAAPLVAGLTMLNHHFEYLDLASEVVAVSKLHSFGHLYNALDILDLYGEMIFTPSRAAAVRGAYYRTYLLSSALKATAIDAVARGESVRSTADSVSSKGLLDKAADICSEELFDTRVLSRDMLKLHDNLTDAFSEMYGVLAPGNVRYPNDVDEVTLRVIRICDCLRPNGELDVRALPGGPYGGIELISDNPAKGMCRKAGEVIESTFSLEVCEQRYFMFPSRVFDEPKSAEPARSESDRQKKHIPLQGSRRKRKKKKKQKKSKKSKTGQATGGATIKVGAAEIDELSDVTNMLQGLLDSLRQKATAAFSTLRDPRLPVSSKANECSSLNRTSARMRDAFFSESSLILHLMQRFHRINNPEVTVPVVAKVRELCATGPELTKFMVFTARIGACVGKMPQAREIMICWRSDCWICVFTRRGSRIIGS